MVSIYLPRILISFSSMRLNRPSNMLEDGSVGEVFRQCSIRTRVLIPLLILGFSTFSAEGSLDPSTNNGNEKEWGLPYYSIYSFDEIGIAIPGGRLGSDSFGRLSIIEDGNYRVFDGKNWEDLLDPERSRFDLTVTKVGSAGRVYSGRVGSWGYLIESNGRIKERHSLKPLDAPEWTNNVRIMDILEFEDYVIYVGDQGSVIHYFKDDTEQYYRYPLATRLAFKFKGKAFVQSDQLGLMVFTGNGFEVISGCDYFNNSRAIVDISPINEDSVLFATLRGGLYHFDGVKTTAIDTEIDHLTQKGVSAVEVLPDGRIVVAIRNEGLFVLSASGKLQIALSREFTTEFSSVYDLYRTKEGILWATLSNGVAKIYLENGITFFDHRMGLPIYWPRVHRLDGKLIIRSENEIYEGIYDTSMRLTGFRLIDLPGLDSAISDIAIHDSGLLITCSKGLFFAI